MPVIGNLLSSHKSGAFGGPSVSPDFISTWDTTQAGSASDTVVLPLESSGIYNGTIDWGDGNSDALSYANRTHVYASSGTYTITISGDVFDAWRFRNTGDKSKITDISNWGIFKFSSVGDARVFDGCNNLTISATDAPNIGTSMDTAFRFCTSLTNEDFSNWDTSTVTIFRNCFGSCTNYNGTVNGWDTSLGTNFQGMFSGASSFNQPLNLFDLSSATNVSRMFNSATSFNQDLDSWDVSNVTSWSEFMRNASAFNGSLAGWTVQGSFNELAFSVMNAFTGIGLDSWDTSGLTSLRKAFQYNPNFNPDISGWDTSGITNMDSVFWALPLFEQDLSNWDITNVTTLNNFMLSTNFNTSNYDALLVGWEATLEAAYPGGVGYPHTISARFGNSQYSCKSLAARNSLITTFGWTITDGGQDVSVNCDFVSTWDTTQAGSASDTVELPLLSGGTYSGTINWGDGNTSSLSYANRSHTYAAGGTYTITISGSDIQGFRFNNGGDRRKITDISNWGNLTITLDRAFFGCDNLDVSATDAPIVSTSSFYLLFRNCTSLTTPNFSNWDTSTVTNMQGMFQGATNFNGDISTWDVSNVTSGNQFREMFFGASSFNGDISTWDMSNATNVSKMFDSATSFNQDIGSWDVSNVTNIVGMFASSTSFNQDIGSWNTSNATSMAYMFYNATSFNQDIGSWDVSSCLNFVYMFRNTPFNQDISAWTFASSGINMQGMFENATSFNQDISTWDVSGVTSGNQFREMFYRATSFNQDIGGWDVSNTSNFSRMLENADAFDQDLSTWDITTASNMTGFMTSATGLSTTNYDALLVAWEATLQAAYPNGSGYTPTINIHFGGSQYSSALMNVGEARYNLINVFGWTITDGGPV